MKWIPRVFSLLVLAFYLSFWLFNEDVRARPTLAVILQGLLTLILLAAWRWQKDAGRLAVVGGIVLVLTVVISGLGLYGSSLWAALLGGALLAMPYILVGLLFYDGGRRADAAEGRQTTRKSSGSGQRRGRS